MLPKDICKSRIFKDLQEYTNLSEELLLKKCDTSTKELAIFWNNKKNIFDFYRTKLYIYDLTQYQILLENMGIIKKLIRQAKKLKAIRILEYGGGIAEFSILCNKNNLDVTYYDLDGETKKYALWRFEKYDCNRIKIAEEDPLNKKWDIVNIMDVLEHLENYKEVIIKLAKNSKYIFCDPEVQKYDSDYPQHISKYEPFLKDYFKKIEGHLWKSVYMPKFSYQFFLH